MSSRRSSRRTYYPTRWSDWEWNEQYQRDARYREVSKGNWEWEYAEPPTKPAEPPWAPREHKGKKGRPSDPEPYSEEISSTYFEEEVACPWPGCGRHFASTDQKDRHYRTIHSNNAERPFKCDVAGCQADVTSWTRAEKLKQHNKQWHGPYPCYEDDCSRGPPNGFASQRELDSHVDIVHSYVGSSTPYRIDEYVDVGPEERPTRGGNEQFNASVVVDSVPSGYTPTQTAVNYYSQDQGSTTTPQYNMQPGYGGVPAYTQPPTNMDSLTVQMSRTKIYEPEPDRAKSRFDSRYKVQRSSFFEFGRVFKVLWSEPVGSGGTDISDDGSEKPGTVTKIRRFLVVRNENGHAICIPILTYGYQGVLKPGVHPGDHAVIFTGRKPFLLEREEGLMTYRPIRVDPASSADKLDRLSRLNYKKTYTVEHNVKVCPFGRVARNYERDVVDAFNEAHPPLAPRTPQPSASIGYPQPYDHQYPTGSYAQPYSPPPTNCSQNGNYYPPPLGQTFPSTNRTMTHSSSGQNHFPYSGPSSSTSPYPADSYGQPQYQHPTVYAQNVNYYSASSQSFTNTGAMPYQPPVQGYQPNNAPYGDLYSGD